MTLNPKNSLEKAIAERRAKAEYVSARRNLVTEVLLVTAALLLIFSFIFGVHIQHGQDMYPAIKDGDVVLYYRTHKLLNTEAVVYETDGKVMTGRIAATEGTVISAVSDMQMTFDGIFIPISKEDGIYDRTYAKEGSNLPMTLGEGAYYILGDNRDVAVDSREFGPVSEKHIKGRIVTVLRRRQI